MAKVRLNPIFSGISGKTGNIVLFTKYGRQYCRAYVRPSNPDTAAQKAVRRTFKEAVHAWQMLDYASKEEYNRMARYRSLSGYNLFMSKYIRANTPGQVAGKSTTLLTHGQAQYSTLTAPFKPVECACVPLIAQNTGQGSA